MGYNTDYIGKIGFSNPLTEEQMTELDKFLGEDVRDHKEWERDSDRGLTWIDLDFTDDGLGIEWNGSEKSYEMKDKLNLILRNMRKLYPEFGFTGELLAQGESIEDRYVIKFTGPNGTAVEINDKEEKQKIFSELEKYESVNQTRSLKELANVIRSFADENGNIQGVRRVFPAESMAINCEEYSLEKHNALTREYGIRQQAMLHLFYGDIK